MSKNAQGEVKGGRIIKAQPVEVTPLGVEASERVAGLVSTLTETHTNSAMAKDTAKAEYERSLFSAEQTKLETLQLIAADFDDMTEQFWNDYVRKPFSEALQVMGLKMPGPVVSMYKVALLALVNGIEPDAEYARDVNKFVNKQARAALVQSGVIEGSNVGRKAGTTSEKTKSAYAEAATVLARHGDTSLAADVVTKRAKMLEAMCTAGNWKLLEKLLEQGCRTAKVKLD